MYKFITLISAFLIPVMTFGQQAGVIAKLDTAAMLIGDHVGLKIQFSGPANAHVIWPVIPDTILGKIQVIGRGKIDTLSRTPVLVLEQSLNLTCYDSGFYAIPQIPVKYRIPPDTSFLFLHSSFLTLIVHTVKVDTTQAIKPIKGPLKIPFTFREMLPWILLGLVSLVLAAGLIWYLKKRKKNEPVFQIRPRVKLHPYELALQELEKLRVKKLWQNGKGKEYHTGLTDILRIYIEARFLVPAMEQTSAEILHSLIDKPGLPRPVWDKLGAILMLADMVKFAKAQPTAGENDGSLETAISFVTETGTTSIKNEELGIKN